MQEQTKELNKQLEDKKLRMLNKLGTKELIIRVEELENKLEESMREEASFRNLNVGYIASAGSDCAEAKQMLAELNVKGPPEDEGKMTAPQKEAWLTRQRVENEKLQNILTRQADVAFQIDNYRISIEMAKKRLESAKAVLGLRTAQINFLAE